MKPSDDRGFWGAGMALWRSGQDGEAIAYFEKAVQLNPNSHAAVDLKLVQRARAIRQREQLLSFERDQQLKIQATKLKIQQTKAKLGIDTIEAERSKYQQKTRELLAERAQLEAELRAGSNFVRFKCVCTKTKKAFRVPASMTSDQVTSFLKELRSRFKLADDTSLTFQVMDMSKMTQQKLTERELIKQFQVTSDTQLIVHTT